MGGGIGAERLHRPLLLRRRALAARDRRPLPHPLLPAVSLRAHLDALVVRGRTAPARRRGAGALDEDAPLPDGADALSRDPADAYPGAEFDPDLRRLLVALRIRAVPLLRPSRSRAPHHRTGGPRDDALRPAAADRAGVPDPLVSRPPQSVADRRHGADERRAADDLHAQRMARLARGCSRPSASAPAAVDALRRAAAGPLRHVRADEDQQ